MNPILNAWLIFGLIGAFCGILTSLIIWAVKALVTKLKPQALLADEEGAPSFLGRVKMSPRGEIIVGKGDNKRHYPVAEASRIQTNSGILYVLGRQTGVNFQVPNKAYIEQCIAEGYRPVWRVYDPFLLARVTAARTTHETLEGIEKGDDWRKTAIPWIAGIAGVAIVGLLVVVGIFAGNA